MPNVAAKPSNVFGLEVFRAGNYPQGEFTAEDLKAIASSYSAGLHAAPFTIDHVAEGPAYGWVNRAFTDPEGKRLFVDAYFTEEMIAAVKAGKFLKRSVEIAKPFEETGAPYLLAVTMLGAKEPAVKGMSDAALSFTAKRSNVFAFTLESAKDQTPMTIDYDKLGAAVAAAFKAAMEPPPAADPKADEKGVAAACDDKKMEVAPAPPAPPTPKPDENTDMAAAPGAEADPRDAKIAELQAMVQQLQGELMKTAEARAEDADMAKFAAVWNDAAKAGKVTPGEENRARSLFASIPRDAVSTDKDESGKPVRVREAYLQFSIAARPVNPTLAPSPIGAAPTSTTTFVAPISPSGDGISAKGTSIESDKLAFTAKQIEDEHFRATGERLDVSQAYRMASARLKGAKL